MRQLNIRGTLNETLRTSADMPYPMGTRMHVPDGRAFRMARADSTALVAYRTMQSALPDVSLRNLEVAPRTVADGARLTLKIPTISDVELPLGAYNAGLLYVTGGSNTGRSYYIEASAAVDRTAATRRLVLTLDGDDISALSGMRVTILKNRFAALKVASAPPDTQAIGVAPCAVAANGYFWLQTHGACVALQDGQLIDFGPVAASRATSGAVCVARNVVPDRGADHRHAGDDDSDPYRGTELCTVVVPARDLIAGPGDERLAEVTGFGVVPAIVLGYALDSGYDDGLALVHLSIEV